MSLGNRFPNDRRDSQGGDFLADLDSETGSEIAEVLIPLPAQFLQLSIHRQQPSRQRLISEYGGCRHRLQTGDCYCQKQFRAAPGIRLVRIQVG